MKWKQLLTLTAVAGSLSTFPCEGATTPAAGSAAYPLITVNVDGTPLEARGILINARTLLPLRELTERLGGVVRWDPQAKTVWAAFPDQGRTVRLMLDSTVADYFEYDPKEPHRTGRLVESRTLDQAPILLGGRVVAPVATMAEVAGAKTFWRPEAKQVLIQSSTETQVGAAEEPSF